MKNEKKKKQNTSPDKDEEGMELSALIKWAVMDKANCSKCGWGYRTYN